MSFNWTPVGEELDPSDFEKIVPVDILYEFDGPMIFTFKNKGSLYLAHMSGQSREMSRFTVSPTNLEIIQRLKKGHISIRTALMQPWLWCIDVDHDDTVRKCWSTSANELISVIPKEGVMLDPSFESIFSVRVDGRNMNHNNVPASAIKRAVDGAYTALKKLSEEINGGLSSGRPSKAWKQIFDLPVQEVRLGSFEISFQEPEEQEVLLFENEESTDSIFKDQCQMFSKALSWATGDSEYVDVPNLQFLEAMEKLVPPQTGLIEKVYIGGRLVRGKSREYILDRQATRKVRDSLSKARSHEEKTLSLSGQPREFDKDRMSFRLRSNSTDYTCQFHEDLYDDVMEVFANDETIDVMLTVKKNSTSGEVMALARNVDEDEFDDAGKEIDETDV